MNIAILGRSTGWHVTELVRASTELGIRPIPIEYKLVVAHLGDDSMRLTAQGELLNKVDAILVRAIPAGTLEQVVFRMNALHLLSAAGVKVINPPRAIETCVDKYLCSAMLARAGLPTPRTVACDSYDAALAAFDELGEDVVLKPLFGSEGRGMIRLDQRPLAERVLLTVSRLNEVIYLQEFVPHPGHDHRALVIGEDVVAVVRRVANRDFRTNTAQGGRCEPVDLAPEWKRIARLAAKAVGAEIAGVDLLPDGNGQPLVLEVNSAPGFQATSAATGVDIARAIMAYVHATRKS